jgi:hypothetical protein
LGDFSHNHPVALAVCQPVRELIFSALIVSLKKKNLDDFHLIQSLQLFFPPSKFLLAARKKNSEKNLKKTRKNVLFNI